MSTALLHRLAFGVWAIEPRQAQAYYGVVANLLSGTPLPPTPKRELKASVVSLRNDDILELPGTDPEEEMPEATAQGNVLVMAINDVILKRGDDCSYGMEDVAEQLQQADADSSITGVVLSIDSPGGEGSAMFLLADTLGRMSKPVVAHINHGTAASAAYGIAAACNEVYASSPQDMFGSTGTYVTLVDMASYMRAKGVPVHEVYATLSTDKNAPAREALRADGTDPDAAQYMRLRQEYIDPFNEAFLALVKEKRPQMAATAEAWQGGKLFYADEALSNGLIDGYSTLAGAIARIGTLAANKPAARGPQPEAAPQQPSTPQPTMKKFSDLWALALTALGFTEQKTTATAEELTAANAELKAMGLQLVSFEQAEALQLVETLKAQAATAEGLKAELATAQAEAESLKAEAATTKETLAAELKALGVELEATADPLAKATETLKEWAAKPAATHTGAQKSGDAKNPNMDLPGHAAALKTVENLPGAKA